MFKNFFVLNIFFIYVCHTQIINNPILLNQKKFPFVIPYSDDDYYYVITSGESLKIHKENGIIETEDTKEFSQVPLYCYDKSNKNYIYESNDFYYIDYSPNLEISRLIYEKNPNSLKGNYIGCIPQDNDFIIYGYDSHDLIFLSLKEDNNYKCKFEKLNEKVSCKYIDNKSFVCAAIFDKNIYIIFLEYDISKNNKKLSHKSSTLYNSNDYINIALYDIKKDIKIICKQKEGNDLNIYCNYLLIKIDNSGKGNIQQRGEEFSFNSNENDFSEKDCSFTIFNNELLFCCGLLNKISCARLNKDLNLVKIFNIIIEGKNTYLSIRDNNLDASIFFMNNNNSVYEYKIFLPNCHDMEYSISDNKDKEIKDKLSNLFLVRANNYYVEFINQLYNGMIEFSLNDEIMNFEEKININHNYYDINFIINNNEEDEESSYIYYKVNIGDVGNGNYEYYSSNICTIYFNTESCYHSCKQCSIDIYNSNKEHHNCIECKGNYYHSPEIETNCFLENEKKINWYLDKNNSSFGLCNTECKSCSGPSNNECLSCFNEKYLYLGNCKDNCPSGYIAELINDNNNYYFNCFECYESCETCLDINKGNSSNMKCEKCKEHYIKNENNCYQIINSTIKNFVDPENNNEESSCYQKFKLYIKEDSNECIKLPEKDEGYYISNNITGLLSKCHGDCLSCDNGIIKDNSDNLISMECLSCKDFNNEDKTMIKIEKNCFSIIQYDENRIAFNINEMNSNEIGSCLYFNKSIYYGQYNCIDKPENAYYVLNGNNNTGVIKNCDISCKSCYGENNEESTNCIECTQNYSKTKYSNTNCVKDELITKNYSQNDYIYNEFIKNNITSYTNFTKVINDSNFIVAIFSSDNMNPEEQIKNGISAIDLGNCTEIIKEYYNISKYENLIILNIETRNKSNNVEENSFNLGKKTQIEIFDIYGKKLNLSVCKEDIKVMKYIGDVKELNLDSAKSLSEQGIDIFNAKDEFFNDICHPYDCPDGKDIILNDRRKDIYQNATFCENGCSYLGMNFNLMVANCKCNSSIFQIEENNKTENVNKESNNNSFESLTKSIISNLIDFNYEVIRCYNLVFNIKILFHNIGFFSMFIMIFLQIIFFFVYLIKNVKPIKVFMKNFNDIYKINKPNICNNKNKKLFPKKDEQTENSFDIHKKSNDTKKIVSNKCLINKKLYKNKGKINNKNKKSKDEDNSKRKLNIKKGNYFKNKIKTKINLKNNSKRNIFVSNNLVQNNNIKEPEFNIKNKNLTKFDLKRKILNYKNIIHKMETISEKKNKFQVNKMELTRLLKNDSELQDMEYEVAIIYDKRSYLRMYWSFLIESQIILETFCTDNHLYLFVVKLSFFICTFQISFFLNALFYTDDYISDAYHNDGVLDFISGLPKSFYSFIATLITTNLLKMLSNSKNELIRVIRRRNKFNNYLNIINIKMKKLRNKLIIYFIFVFLLGILFLYYVTSFCAVYRNSQKYWFIGCLESFAIDSLVSVIVCVFTSFLRYISIRNKVKCCYILSNIINIFF